MGTKGVLRGYVLAVIAALGIGAASQASAKERLIFVINTMEDDVLGGVSTPYIDEHRWMQRWKKNFPDAKVIRIRSNTNRGVTMQLNTWMQPNPEMKEIVALDIHSHGAEMLMLNESADFVVRMPQDIPKTFAPIIGRFAEGARIVIGGCEILSNKNQTEALISLKSIADTFQMRDGYVYANETVGAEGTNAFLVNVWNEDIPWEQRKRTLKVYAAWFLTLPSFAYQDRFNSNQGYLLEAHNGETARFGRLRYLQNFEPDRI